MGFVTNHSISITTYCHPYGLRCCANQSALALNCASLMVVPYPSQLFQPIGGVAARTLIGESEEFAPPNTREEHNSTPIMHTCVKNGRPNMRTRRSCTRLAGTQNFRLALSSKAVSRFFLNTVRRH